MLNLKPNTKIMFIHKDHGYMGWNTLGNLVGVLAARYSEDHASHTRIDDALNTLAERGWLSPQDVLEAAHWIVEKSIPFDIRGAVRADEVPTDNILKQLKV